MLQRLRSHRHGGPVAATPPAVPVEVAQTEPLLDWNTVLGAAGMWLATRVAFVLFTYFAAPFNAQSSVSRYVLAPFPPSALLDMWSRWDTGWYIRIAQHGYDIVRTAAFFPLYPVLIHTAAFYSREPNLLVVALVVANVGTLGAFIALGLLAKHECGPDARWGAIRVFAAFPLAFFLAGGYSDGLFIALATFSLYFARRGRWEWAAICAVLAALTRLFGLALILPLLWEYAAQHRAVLTDRRDPRVVPTLAGGLAVAAAVPAALALFALFLWKRRGDPLAYLTVQRHYWDHYAVWPWDWVRLTSNAWQHVPAWSFFQVRLLFDWAPVVAIAVVTILAARRLPVSLLLYLVVTLLICITSAVPGNVDPITGEGRYMLMATPAFVIAGAWLRRRPGWDILVIGAGFMLQGLFTAFFLRGGWLV